MKLAASVSFAALALAACTTVQPAPAVTPVAAAENDTPGTTEAPPAQYPLTPAGADAFVAAVEKDLFDYSLEAAQVNWVNSTYITDDTDAMAARINSVGTEKSVKYASMRQVRQHSGCQRTPSQARHPAQRDRSPGANHARRRRGA